MRLMILTAAVFPSEADARKKLWIFLKSAEKAGVPQEDLHLYGIGREFPGYRALCLDYHLEYLKEHRGDGYTHCLFSDGWDAFFTAPLTEIIQKYERLGSPPILCSAYIGLGNESDMSKYAGCFDESILYRYPNRGGYIAEIPAIIEAFERMLRNPDLTGDDCHSWYAGWREGWFRPQLDSKCLIFQVSDNNADIDSGFYSHEGRLWNTVTDMHPCILHLSGGYTDPETGKDDRMVPWAKRLGII